MLYAEINCTSVLSVISLSDKSSSDAISMLTTIASRPPNAAGVGRVCRGSLAAVRAVMSMIELPAVKLLEIESSLSKLDQVIEQELRESGSRELAQPTINRTGMYPQWTVLANLAESDMHLGALLAGGVELLRAWKDVTEITKAATVDIANAIRGESLSKDDLRLLLNGLTRDDEITFAWHKRLRRSWGHVVRHFAQEGSALPVKNFADQARGQIRDSSFYASPTLRAGACDHRQLSKLQMRQTLKQIGKWIDDDDFRGAYGFFVCTTGLTADLIPMIPLQSPAVDSEWVVAIDIEEGCLKMDVSALAEEAAQATTTAVIKSNFVCSKPLPKNLAARLRSRLEMLPNACCLQDLFPTSTDLDARAPVIRSHDEIKPSWARLRNSSGTFLRQLGIDNLLACICSGDFGHIPKSKLYYACVEPDEIFQASTAFYLTAGWETPVPMSTDSLAFGCRVVPTDAQIHHIDQWWQESIHAKAPAKHCNLDQVLVHHNYYMSLCGFRLALVLAMREQHEFNLRAEIDERVDRWLPLDDKTVPGVAGALPVPLTKFAAQTISALRVHCRALHSRLHQQGLQRSALARWCEKVELRQSGVSLLMKAATPNRLQNVGTHDCLEPLPKGLVIAPDFGRKVMENALRHRGLRTGDIDAVLRHSVLGQSRESSVSDFNLLDWLKRVTPVMDALANDLFGSVCYGLSRE